MKICIKPSLYSTMTLRYAGIIIIHPYTRAAHLHCIYSSKHVALQNAIWLFKQDIEKSSLRHMIVPRLYVGDNDEIESELKRLRFQVARAADNFPKPQIIPHIYSVISHPELDELV